MIDNDTSLNEIIESSEEEVTAGERLDDKYASQMRQIFPQKIELPITALVQMIREQIKLDPDFQRRGRWDVRRQSRLIESVIMNVPIPPVFLGEDEYGSYVVLDGRQRLTAVYDFLRNAYALEQLEVWKELNGKRYLDLENAGLHKTLTRRFIPAILLLKESSPEVKYDVFDRLNTGGVTANQMEIRNAIFQGPFNRLLHKLSTDPTFMQLWDIPGTGDERITNILFSTMADVQLVLRFMALRRPDQITGSFKWYLGHYMDERNKEAKKDSSVLEQSEEEFKRALAAVTAVFGTRAFVRSSTGNKSAPLADAVMVAFSEIDVQKLTETNKVDLRNAFNRLDDDPDFRKSVTSGTNGKGAISTRIAKAREVVAAVVNHALVQ